MSEHDERPTREGVPVLTPAERAKRANLIHDAVVRPNRAQRRAMAAQIERALRKERKARRRAAG